MMKTLKLLLVIWLGSCSLASAQAKDDVIGKWMNKSATSIIEIYYASGKYQGRIAWLKEPRDSEGKIKTDKNNPITSERTKPLPGLEILKGFSFRGNSWEGGTIYDPRTGKTYTARITMNGPNVMDLRGYVGISMLGKTETFKRVK